MATNDEVISPEVLGFDPDALAQRYAAERDKRIRADAEAQFVQLSHDSPFTNKYLEDDPYCKALDRAPLKDQREVIVIGGGWVGMLTAARLVEAGISDVRIVESGGDFGGTWYWNRYPGAQCDIESYSYLPAAGRNRLCAKAAIFVCVRDLRARPENRQAFRSL